MANKSLFSSPKAPAATVKNDAGGLAYKLSTEAELAQLVLTGTFHNTFYATGGDQLKQAQGLVQQCSSEFIAKLAVYARQQGYMKDMPVYLLAALSTRKDSESQELLRLSFPRVIDNGKMLRNYVQMLRSGVMGRKSLGSLPKRLVRQWFASREAWQIFNNSIGNDPSLADVIRLAHIKPEDGSKDALYKYILGYEEFDVSALPNNLKEYLAFKKAPGKELPKVGFEFLTSLPLTKEHWVTLAYHMSWTQLRMNLNTLARHGVFESSAVVRELADKLANPELIAKSRVFPYQIYAAAKAATNLPPRLTEALHEAMEISTSNVPALPDGEVAIAVDVSGSMSSAVTGNRGTATTNMTCIEVASVMASAYLRQNRNSVLLPFSDKLKPVSLTGRDSILTNAKKLASLGGGGTDCSLPLKALLGGKETFKSVVMISDNESWIDTRKTKSYYASTPGTEVMECWNKYSRRGNTKLACIDIQPRPGAQAPNREDILNVGGFSDHVFAVTAAFFAGDLGGDHLAKLIMESSLS